MQTLDDSGQPVLIRQVHTWPAIMTVGLLTMALGIVVLVWPSETLKVVAVVVGIQVLVYGVFRLVSAFSGDTAAPPILIGLTGVMGMVIGVAVLRHPFEAVAVLAVLLGIIWIVGGFLELLSALTDPAMPRRGLSGLSGAVSLVAGIVVISWPAPTVTVLAWIAGLHLLVFGIVFCAMALSVRSAEQ